MKHIFLSDSQKRIWFILGMILSISTFFIVFALFYTVFFERELYLRRKEIYKLIKNNVRFLKHIKFTGLASAEFYIDDRYKIILWSNNNWSVHAIKFECSSCYLSDFKGDVVNWFMYNTIQKELIRLYENMRSK